ncbi:PEP-CTERM sorting domain-containing protein [Phycisphaera mikurensis]|uniref:Ice-binding protein C-terminal domain-containing protein n=1 Tax=Phycisphaera mikurensis (strain NBRC 102666 / KCTC 22515 / FYK2301M01) TaxID=1142394 RepID=I0ICP0_PHYMF|nr:PEP-CTERM sorting domain-containing protein [Phycisphaera mikurensis]MBB6442099.1 hypothetical protein [Phycisphaera mikurensis]BAM03028.1 hypothetical protein PSMK_08690 [Phycisphaera mikurensis NBRC 102666]
MSDSAIDPSASKSLTRPEQLGWYSLAAGAALAGAVPASAAVMSRDLNLTFTNNDFSSNSLQTSGVDIDGNGTVTDVSVVLYNYGGTRFKGLIADLGVVQDDSLTSTAGGDGTPYARVLAPGETVGPASSFDGLVAGNNQTMYLDAEDDYFGLGRPYASLTDALVGFQFTIDGEAHFGYVEVSYPDQAGANILTLGTAFWESTPGAAIVVPEPGSLALLAAGAGALAGYRRRSAA